MEKSRVAFNCEIKKVDEDARIVYSTLLEAEKYDLQGQIISIEEIAKAAYGFMQSYQIIGEMHKTEAKAQIVESYVGVDWNGVPGWHVGTRILDDKLWAKVMDGTYKGNSIGGWSNVSPDPAQPMLMRLTGLEVVEYSFVDLPAVPAAMLRIFKSAGEPDSEEELTLAQQVAAGQVKGRVKTFKQFCQGIACVARRLLQLGQELDESVIDDTLAEGEQTQTEEVEMTTEEMKAMLAEALEPVGKLIADLGEKVEGVIKQQEAAASTSLAEVSNSLTGKVDALQAKLDELAAQPAQSHVIKDDGTTGKKPPQQFKHLR